MHSVCQGRYSFGPENLSNKTRLSLIQLIWGHTIFHPGHPDDGALRRVHGVLPERAGHLHLRLARRQTAAARGQRLQRRLGLGRRQVQGRVLAGTNFFNRST